MTTAMITTVVVEEEDPEPPVLDAFWMETPLSGEIITGASASQGHDVGGDSFRAVFSGTMSVATRLRLRFPVQSE